MTATVADLKTKFKQPSIAELELIARYAMLPEDGRRERAFEVFAETGLPHRRMEAWKWSDFRAALTTIEAPKKASGRGALPVTDGDLVFRFTATGAQFPNKLPAGLTLHRRSDVPAFSGAEDAPLGAMTAALSGRKGEDGGLIIEVTGNITQPLHIICEGDRDEANMARLGFVVREGASLELVESHLGGAGLSSFLSEITLEDKAKLRRTLLQHGGRDEAQAITAIVKLGAAAEFTQTALAFGAKVSRIETRLTHQRAGSKAVLNAAYLCADGYHADMTSHIRHGAPSCVTRQTTKGAVLDGGTGVFQGKFYVPRDIGQHTDADMQHQALLLEEGAQVFAKPELEIYADDVECAHGNTSGSLDEDQLFYLRQRGIPLAQARGMLTQAFIAEALEEASETVSDALLEAASRFLSGVN